jgi:hypothetical protein
MLRRVALGTLGTLALLAPAAAVGPAAAQPSQAPAGQVVVPVAPALGSVTAPATGPSYKGYVHKHYGMTMCNPNSTL